MKEIKKKLILLCVVGLFVTAVTAVPASAVLISLGNDPLGEPGPTSEFAMMDDVPQLDGIASGLQGWWIQDPDGSPQEIAFGPGYWWWPKLLWGSQIGTPFEILEAGTTEFVIRESLMVNDHEADWCWWWWDWEELWWPLNPGWVWGNNPIFAVNGTILDPTVELDPSGEIAFKLNDPLLPGYIVDIWKPIYWVGPDQWIPGVPGYGPLLIYEWPTPEPATMALLALGGLALLRRRRKA